VILGVITDAIPAPRSEVNPKAPRILSISIPVDKIGEVIGPKGKRINEIIALTGADIDIQDDGTVFIGSKDGESAEKATTMIDEILNPRMPQVGEQFEGTVVKTTTFGAFVSLLPGKDGLLHISKLGGGKRVSAVEDVVNVGDKINVVVREVDKMGRVSLDTAGGEEGEGTTVDEGQPAGTEAGEEPRSDERPRPPRDDDRHRRRRGPRR
jgi:polyribonucleotide nucleotidyltransferase